MPAQPLPCPQMYLSTDDARSDFFLAAAAYVIGPSLLSLLISAVPGLFANTPMQFVVTVLVPVLLIAGMPLFLLRYREESFDSLFSGGGTSFTLGVTIALVFAAALAVGEVLGGGQIAAVFSGIGLVGFLGVIARWGSLAILAVFLYRRAEYAFRPISQSQQTLVRQAGIACAGTAVVATLLLMLGGQPIWALLPAVGLAGMFWFAEQRLPQSGMGERWWVWAPVITLALGPIEIFSALFDGSGFLASAQRASSVALFGLVTVMALENRRGAMVAFGMAAAFVVANILSVAGGTQFLV